MQLKNDWATSMFRSTVMWRRAPQKYVHTVLLCHCLRRLLSVAQPEEWTVGLHRSNALGTGRIRLSHLSAPVAMRIVAAPASMESLWQRHNCCSVQISRVAQAPLCASNAVTVLHCSKASEL